MRIHTYPVPPDGSAQMEETTYSFLGSDEEVRFVADEDDEMKTTVSHGSLCQQKSTEDPSVSTQNL